MDAVQSLARGYEMASTMKPLEPFRDKLLVLSNLMQNGGRALKDGAGDHARAGASWLTGVHPKKTEGFDIRAGISADQIAAQQLGKQTQFGSLEIGLEEPNLAGGCDSGYSCAYTNTISWRTPTSPNPMEVNPRRYLSAFSETEKRRIPQRRPSASRRIVVFSISFAEMWSAWDPDWVPAIRVSSPNTWTASATSSAAFRRRSNSGPPSRFRSWNGYVYSRRVEEHSKLMSDLMVIAFQTDMTRVVSYMMAREGSNRSYRSIGFPTGITRLPTTRMIRKNRQDDED